MAPNEKFMEWEDPKQTIKPHNAEDIKALPFLEWQLQVLPGVLTSGHFLLPLHYVNQPFCFCFFLLIFPVLPLLVQNTSPPVSSEGCNFKGKPPIKWGTNSRKEKVFGENSHLVLCLMIMVPQLASTQKRGGYLIFLSWFPEC